VSQFEDSDGIAGVAGEMLRHLDLPGDARISEALASFAIALCRANRKTNLTGAKGPEAFVRGPLFDALTLLPVLANDEPLVDVGSGAGLPGIPAALWRPSLRVALVEPRPLRAAFLRRAVEVLGIEATVIEAKEAALGDGSYAAAVSQAVWPAPEWIGRAVRLVRPGGAIYALASTPIDAGALPAGCIIEARFETRRPLDGALRFAARVRRAL
jgi:16S rRNA (guanine527-N7)-methyltransferase